MPDLSSQRPSEKVRAYLLRREREGALTPGARLPATEELAAHLDVSPGTVKNVYRALSRDGRVRTQVGQGSFWTGTNPHPGAARRIGISIHHDPAPESQWWKHREWTGRVFGGILQGKLGTGQEIIFQSSPALDEIPTGERADRLADLDGVISLTLHPVPEPLSDPQGRVIPCVTLNPQGELSTSNFVSPDYFESSYRLGAIWGETGRERVLMVTHTELSRSPSTRLRYSGLACGLGERIGKTVDLRLVNLGEREQTERLKAYLAQGWLPDALYTTGGGLVFQVMDALAACGMDVPGACSVVSGSGYSVANIEGHLPVTTMSHPLEEVGRALLAMLLRRIANGGVPEPGRYIGVPFNIGGSTLPEENALFTRYSRQVIAARDGRL